MKKVLIIGSTVTDIIINIDHLPKTSEDIHVLSQNMSLGGCAFNVCHVLHNLNVPYYFISNVGKGIYGDYVKHELNQLNIDNHSFSDDDNGCCYCMIESNGERTFISNHGAEYHFYPDTLNEINLNDFDYLYICGLEIEDRDGEILVESIKNYKGTIIFAPGPRVKYIRKDLINKILNKLCILHLNEKEIIELSLKDTMIEAAKALYQITNNYIIITCANYGTYYFDGKEIKNIKAYQTEIINTNGAGDSHCGAMISALCYGYNIIDAIDFANLLASKVVNNQNSHLDNNQYLEFLNIL